MHLTFQWNICCVHFDVLYFTLLHSSPVSPKRILLPYYPSSLKTKLQSSLTPSVPFVNYELFLQNLPFIHTDSAPLLPFITGTFETTSKLVSLSLISFSSLFLLNQYLAISLFPKQSSQYKRNQWHQLLQNKWLGDKGGREERFTPIYHLVSLKICASWIY